MNKRAVKGMNNKKELQILITKWNLSKKKLKKIKEN